MHFIPLIAPLQVLGEVVDHVLYEPGLSKDVALNRAKVGSIPLVGDHYSLSNTSE
jgi:hypothetical protein